MDERLADFARREAKLAEEEREVERRIAAAETQLSELLQAQTETEQARRELDKRFAELADREAALAGQEQELKQAAAQADEQQLELARARVELAELEEMRCRYDESLAEIRAREDALQSERLDVERFREKARKQVESTLAEVSERERVVSAREARVEGFADFEARERRLTNAVRATATEMAETMVKTAREQARLILANARAGREPPPENTRTKSPLTGPMALRNDTVRTRRFRSEMCPRRSSWRTCR